MDFGIWVEPEMVNPDSDLYRQHPDWAMHFPDRPRTEARNQLVLNMARNDVKNYIFGALDRLLSENPGIAFIKWDMNRNFSEPGWPEEPPRRTEGALGGLHAQRLRDHRPPARQASQARDRVLLRRRRARGLGHPHARRRGMDVRQYRRLRPPAHPGGIHLRPHAQDHDGLGDGRAQLQWPLYAATVSLPGGHDGVARHRRQSEQMVGADMALAARMVELYKSIRKTVQEGRLYRLFSPQSGGFSATEYVAEDGRQAVLFAFRSAQHFGYPPPTVRLSGLDEQAIYRVRTIDNKLVEPLETASGAYLMNRGVNLRLGGDFDSTALVLERVP